MGKSRIFIAGHRGMVGSALQRKLKSMGHDALITRSRAALDLTDQAQVRDFFLSENIDEVYLAAARVGGIKANNSYPADFIYDNLIIQCNVIHAAHLAGVRKLLFLGSSCIYPREAKQPMTEDILLTGSLEPTNEPYAVAKIAGIKLCESYNRQHGRDFRSVMPTNLYGSGDNYDLESGHVAAALIRKMHLGKCLDQDDWQTLRRDLNKRPLGEIDGRASSEMIFRELKKHGISQSIFSDSKPLTTVTIWGSGNPRREFLHVDDMASACVHVMNLPKKMYQESTRPMLSHINVGTGIDCTIRELAEIIAKVVGFQGNISFDASKPDGAPQKLLDVSRLRSLGWEAGIDLSDGLDKTYLKYK